MKDFEGLIELIINNNDNDNQIEETIEQISKILENDPTLIGKEDDNGLTLIHHASSISNSSKLKFLLNWIKKQKQKENSEEISFEPYSKKLHLDNILDDQTDEGSTPLHIAAEEGHTEIVKFLIKEGADLNIQDDFYKTPLHYAAENGHINIVQELLKKGALPNLVDEELFSAFMYACENGHTEIVQFFLKNEQSVNVNLQDIYGCSALYFACSEGHIEIVKLLLKLPRLNFLPREGYPYILSAPRIFINIQQSGGKDSLMIAVEKQRIEIVQLLITEGIKINQEDQYGSTALSTAIERKYTNIISYLIKAHQLQGVRISDNNYNIKASIKIINLLEFFLKNGEDPNSVSKKYGYSALMQAVEQGNILAIEKLIKYKASINHADIKGKTALIYAVKRLTFKEFESISAMEILIKNKANINHVDKKGNTALHYAVKAGGNRAIALLVENGANIYVSNYDNHTPLILAIQRGYKEVVEYLLTFGALLPEDDSAIIHALEDEQKDIVEILLRNNANISGKNESHQDNVLMLAIRKGYTDADIVNILVERNISINYSNKDLETALHLAAKNGHIETVKLLISHGAIVNIQDIKAKTPLDYAIETRYQEIEQILFDLPTNIEDVAIPNNAPATRFQLNLDNNYNR